MAIEQIDVTLRGELPIDRIMIGDRKRPLGDVIALAQSIKDLGLLNPITVTADGSLVAGYHRLEACKSLGWQSIPVNIVDLDSLSAELAEIDENLIRNELHWFDRDKQLARRKEIYEDLHPETKNGAKGGPNNSKTLHNENDTVSFSLDTSSKTGVAERTIERSIQRAKAFTDEDGEVLKQAGVTQTEATKLARLGEPARVATLEGLRNRDNIPIAVPHISSKNNEWYTPEKYILAAREVMGAIDLDPASCELANQVVKAAKYYDTQMNGLDYPWHGRVWLNPPYGRGEEGSNQDIWSARLIDQYERGNTTAAILLVNAAVDTRWFQRLFHYPVCFPAQRINFLTPEPSVSGSTHGSALVYFGRDKSRFFEVFGRFGTVVRRW